MKGGMGEKVCLITGATSGIGKATAMGLANMGASVVMVGRDRGRGEAAMADIIERSGNASVDLMLADVSSQEEIRRLADEFKETYPRLSISKWTLNLHGSQQAQSVQDGLLQLAHGIVEPARHQETLEPSPHPLDEVQVRAVRRQPVQGEPPRLPLLLALSNDSGGVERGVVQNDHARFVLPPGLVRQGVQVEEHFPGVARTLQHLVLQPLVAFAFHTERAHEVDAPLGAPPSLHPMLVSLSLLRPGVRGRQAQVEAALVEVLQHDLPFRSPLLRASSSSLASISSSGSGALLGT